MTCGDLQGLAEEGDERFHGYKPPGEAPNPTQQAVEREGEDEL